MSVYADQTIQCENERSFTSDGLGSIKVERVSGGPLSIQPGSVDLHLSDEFLEPSAEDTVVVDDPDTYPQYSYVNDDSYVIEPRQFVLAEADEYISLDRGTIGYLWGRSSVGRLGPFIHNAGLVDPGYAGNITLELWNAAPYPIELKAGMRICQLTFHGLTESSETGYADKAVSKYQGQTGVTPSRLYEDFNE